MKPVIFLDIDGVLITLKSFGQGKKSGRSAQPMSECVEQLNRIVRETGAGIVLSSTWRYDNDPVELLHRFRVEAECLGATPELIRQTRGSSLVVVPQRGDEIRQWLTINEGVERFVILDDDDDMGKLKPFLVQTTFADGLTAETADDAISLLKSENLKFSGLR